MSVSRAIMHLSVDGRLAREPTPGAMRIWPYTQKWVLPIRVTRESLVDPANILVADMGPAEVLRALASQGFAVPDDGGIHRLGVGWRLRWMAAHTALGNRHERSHVRLWAVGRHTVAAAHHEIADERGHHIVVSWEAAREAVVSALIKEGFLLERPSEVVTKPDLRGVPSDGRVSHLRAPTR